jgi:hypothetical protein
MDFLLRCGTMASLRRHVAVATEAGQGTTGTETQEIPVQPAIRHGLVIFVVVLSSPSLRR